MLTEAGAIVYQVLQEIEDSATVPVPSSDGGPANPVSICYRIMKYTVIKTFRC